MDLMDRLAKVFEVSVDCLIRDKENVTISKIKNPDLRHPIEEMNALPDAEHETAVSFLDAFIKR